MPSRNIVKLYDVNTYYHIYNRGIEKRKIFLDGEDYAVFLNLLKRYLDKEPVKDSKGREYFWLANDLQVVAFCLMPNHFHILLYQIEKDAMTKLLRAVCTSYTTYFNKKYKRIGPLFQSNFKASIIRDETYLTYITRYIHRNPSDYRRWQWSSLPYWLGEKKTEWIHPEQLQDMTRDQYLRFVQDDGDYELSENLLENIGILADR